MNRCLVSGRLLERPKLARTPCGIPVASFCVVVAREVPPPGAIDQECSPEVPDPPGATVDPIYCLAAGKLADQLDLWGERGAYVEVEGRLRHAEFTDTLGRPMQGARVWVDHLAGLERPSVPAPKPGLLGFGNGLFAVLFPQSKHEE